MLEQQKKDSFAVHGAASIKIKDIISKIVADEANALLNLELNMPDEAVLFVEKIINTRGKVIFSGIGKSGLVAQKIAATFSSLGIPSIFVHACDALHGDLGMMQQQDLFVGISKSASGEELECVYSVLNNRASDSVLICCSSGQLCSLARLVIRLPLQKEACLLNLAPTSSSTLMQVFGDALAVAVSSIKNFNKADFAKNHPAGALGRRLTLTVQHFMHGGLLSPTISLETKFSEILYTISSKKLGVAVVVDGSNKLLGLITDGDLRRACDKFGPSVFDKKAADVMTLNPKTIDFAKLAFNALEMMDKFNITSLIVTEHDNIVVGVIHVHDLIKAGIKA
ncbi:MAG: KpsF/GutQ family protein [candidate division TM6 bacterium GW2011_GWF2_37_49]|nr:MAG: KpsF/GutQ family protein [candidate division TM6 bacterium GW2011_GWF2_37_49]